MANTNRTSNLEHNGNYLQQPIAATTTPDAELVCHFEAQRESTRSDEWRACVDLTLRQLRNV